MNIVLPQYVKNCILTLEKAGYEAFCVGGAVRDIISKIKTPVDFDVTTNCPPDKICALFKKTIPTGIKHGTVTVIIDDTPLEVTTYRIDGDYTDSRHPDKVSFTKNITDDLARRDFTVNAIAYNDKVGVFDPFDGCGDIERKLLRTVGDANVRFKEDALRIMRLFRFASQLGFTIEGNAKESALQKAGSLCEVSAERIAAELFKMLTGEHLKLANDFFTNGCLKPFSANKCDITALTALPCSLLERFSCLCILSGTDVNEVCDALKTDNTLRKNALAVCDMLRSGAPASKAGIKQYLAAYNEENFLAFLNTVGIFCEGDRKLLYSLLEEIKHNNEPYLISHLAVNGNDLRSLSFSGKEIGEKLEILKNAVIEEPELNKKETLLNLITK